MVPPTGPGSARRAETDDRHPKCRDRSERPNKSGWLHHTLSDSEYHYSLLAELAYAALTASVLLINYVRISQRLCIDITTKLSVKMIS